MAPRKLTESDKQEILSLYRRPEETTATLASRFGVSNSTISRLLKQNLPEYERLVQQKRAGKFQADPELLAPDEEIASGAERDDEPVLAVEPDEVQAVAVELKAETPTIAPPRKRQRRRLGDAGLNDLSLEDAPSQLELMAAPSEPDAVSAVKAANLLNDPLPALKPEFDDELEPEDDLDDEDDDEEDLEDLDDDDLDDLDDDEDDAESAAGFGDYAAVQLSHGGKLQVLPLAEAHIPRTCYVVVDRASELITRPLKDFAELGQIPAEEVQEKTLPIFDNHRVAKRFLRRMQRVVKVPDGRVFQKVRPYLQAKGITRLLIAGQIYSL